MRGGPEESIETEFYDSNKIWDWITMHVAAGDLLTAGTMQGHDTDADPWGIVLGHAYTIAGVKILSDGTRLVRARNPWGKDSFRGQYGATASAYTPNWSTFVAEVPDAENEDDGYVYMTPDQVRVSFKRLSANFNTEKMHFDYYLKFDDAPKLKAEKDPVFEYASKKCGEEDCIFHNMKVYSKVNQKVWFTLNTYSAKTLPTSCVKAAGNR
mmetsp:Transcript_16325/g.20695  ORF Transcript_16325/g.20695 Transcript_16325/m.20695 type:complete len:211 (-) Transcript_16325:1267-1899(-)